MSCQGFAVCVVEDEASLNFATLMGLIRVDIAVNIDRNSPDTYVLVADYGKNISNVALESKSTLQIRCRTFDSHQVFSLRVTSNSWRKDTREGNAQYTCKKLKGKQFLITCDVLFRIRFMGSGISGIYDFSRTQHCQFQRGSFGEA
jgi:hypothetical protein